MRSYPREFYFNEATHCDTHVGSDDERTFHSIMNGTMIGMGKSSLSTSCLISFLKRYFVSDKEEVKR